MNNNEQLRTLLEEMQECFGAASTEGLEEKMRDEGCEPGTISDIVQRRLLCVPPLIEQAILLARPAPAADAGEAYRVVEDALGCIDDGSESPDAAIARKAKEALPALRPQQWLPITGELKLERKIAVTNNIGARNAHGEMNHVWLVDMVFASKERPGEYGAFDRNNRLYGLTHYADCLPAAPKQEG